MTHVFPAFVLLVWSLLGLRDNCYTWAWRQYFRDGGYIAFRRTRRKVWGWTGLFRHWFHSSDMITWRSWVPKDDNGTHWLTRWTGIPLLWFDGEIKEGDLST